MSTLAGTVRIVEDVIPRVSMPAAIVIGLSTEPGSNCAVSARFWADGTT